MGAMHPSTNTCIGASEGGGNALAAAEGMAEQQYCIIAEAAKKAEMACLMRDLGEVGI